MTRQPETRSRLYRLLECLVDAVAMTLPANQRAAWKEEWLGELWYGYATTPRREQVLAFPKHFFGLLRDAWTVKRVAMSNRPQRGRSRTMLRSILQDVHFGARTILHARRTTTLVVVTIGVGIGAGTAIFGVVNSLLLTPLPHDDADRIVNLWRAGAGPNADTGWLSAGEFVDIRTQSQSFEALALAMGRSAPMTGHGDAEELGYVRASSAFFRVFGIGPSLGRLFTEADDRDGAPRVTVLTHALWQRRFGGDSTVVGRRLTFDEQHFEIVGVLPATFALSATELPSIGGIGQFDLITSLQLSDTRLADRTWALYNVVGKLKEGVSVTQAQKEVDVIASRFSQQRAGEDEVDDEYSIAVLPLLDEVVGHVRPALYLLLGSAAILMLIACANVANLLLTRSAARQRELAVWVAIGAKRSRLIRRLLVESLLMTILGGLLAVGVAAWIIEAIRALAPTVIPRVGDLHLDARVLLFSAALSLVACVLGGLLPAIKSTKIDVAETLRGAGRGTVDRAVFRRRLTTPDVMVMIEIALSLMLLVAGGLLARSFLALVDVDPGYGVENRLTLKTMPPSHLEREGWREFYTKLLARLRALPDVQAAGAGWPVPLAGGTWLGPVEVEGHVAGPADEAPNASYGEVWPGYMEALDIRLVAGRFFDEGDIAPGAEPTAIVDDLFARRFAPDGSVLGIHVGDHDHPLARVVGVVRHVRNKRIDRDGRMTVFFPAASGAIPWYVVLKTRNDAASAVPMVRQQIAALDANVAVADVRTMPERLADQTATHRLALLLLGSFSAVALLLAAVGVFGVVSYRVSQGSREIAMRKALGATDENIWRLVVGQGLFIGGIGVATGVCGAAVLTRFLTSMLFEIGAADPLTYIVVAVFLSVIVLLSCYVPVRRAVRLDPATVLNSE
jgi:predicted permease